MLTNDIPLGTVHQTHAQNNPRQGLGRPLTPHPPTLPQVNAIYLFPHAWPLRSG